MQIVGDDIYVTNTKFIRQGIAEKTTNAVLIKLNQIGTVTETIEAIEMCREAGWRTSSASPRRSRKSTACPSPASAMRATEIST